MAVPETKPVFKRDASGRTMDQRSVKIDSAIKKGNADYRLSLLRAQPTISGFVASVPTPEFQPVQRPGR